MAISMQIEDNSDHSENGFYVEFLRRTSKASVFCVAFRCRGKEQTMLNSTHAISDIHVNPYTANSSSSRRECVCIYMYIFLKHNTCCELQEYRLVFKN